MTTICRFPRHLGGPMRYYPDLSQKVLVPLRVLREHLRTDPAFLDDPTCPYDQDTKEFLKLLAPSVGTEGGSTFLGRSGSKHEILEREAADLYDEIKTFGRNLKVDDVTERMSYFRTRTTLLEKLISLTERAASMKSFFRFQDAVLAIFEDLLTPDQREEALERLRSISDAPENED